MLRAADGADVALLTVRVEDRSGRLVPDADDRVSVSVSGPGALLGLANGDPAGHERERPAARTEGRRAAWHGLLRVVVQAGSRPGALLVRCSAAGLAPSSLRLSVV